MQLPKDLVQVPLQGHGGFHGVLNFAPFTLRRLQHILGEDAATALVLHLTLLKQEADPGPWAALSPVFLS